MLTARFIISGRVHGVGFRIFVQRAAAELGLRGWVRNCSNGTVEVLAQGTPAALGQLESRLAAGPPQSSVVAVRRLTVASGEESRANSFQIRLEED